MPIYGLRFQDLVSRILEKLIIFFFKVLQRFSSYCTSLLSNLSIIFSDQLLYQVLPSSVSPTCRDVEQLNACQARVIHDTASVSKRKHA